MNQALAARALSAARLAETARGALRTWRALRWRHWVVVLAVGLVCGIGQWMEEWLTLLGDNEGAPLPLLIGTAIKQLPISLIAAVLMLLGLALLDRHDRGPAPPFSHYAALVVAIGLLAGGVIGHHIHLLTEAGMAALGLRNPYAGALFSWPNTILFGLGRTVSLMIPLALATLVYLYIRNARRTAEHLASAQLRRAEAERRLLADELNGAQAMVEPELLFDTLRRIEDLFEHDAAGAQRLLDALIAYLRCAMPAADGSSTVGQQAELVRARLEIERIRLGGRLHFEVDVAPAVAQRPFAPLLLAPLAENAIRHGIEPAGGGKVAVQARQLDDRLVLEVSDTGAGRAGAIREGGGLAGVRERLARLYGERAHLVLADREPQGLCARLELETESRT